MLLVRSKFLNKNLDSRRFALRSFICYWTSFEIRNYTFVYNLDRIVRLIKAKSINSFVANFNLIFHLSATTWIRYNDDIYLRSIFFQNVRFVNRFLISLRIIFTKRGTIYIEIDFLISNQIEDRTVSSALEWMRVSRFVATGILFFEFLQTTISLLEPPAFSLSSR